MSFYIKNIIFQWAISLMQLWEDACSFFCYSLTPEHHQNCRTCVKLWLCKSRKYSGSILSSREGDSRPTDPFQCVTPVQCVFAELFPSILLTSCVSEGNIIGDVITRDLLIVIKPVLKWWLIHVRLIWSKHTHTLSFFRVWFCFSCVQNCM